MQNAITNSRLIPVTRQRCLLHYDIQCLEGAMRRPYMAVAAVERLNAASDFLDASSTPARRLELLIWDAYRTQETQRAIFERYVRELRSEQGLGEDKARSEASGFVSLPDSVFPHGTGGTVDLTLLVNGSPACMGTGFDEFAEHAAADWYRRNAPETTSDATAASNRETLREAMEAGGFVVLDSEWWHFEWGTARWAREKGCAPVLDRLLPPPAQANCAVQENDPSQVQPVWFAGVAQVFPDAGSRAAALRHEAPGHYYARSTHPTTGQLSYHLRTLMIPADHSSVACSGLATARAAFEAMIPPEGTVLYDTRIYYEVQRALLQLASQRGWRLRSADFLHLDEVEAALRSLDEAGRLT